MGKVAFSKLGLKVDSNIKTITYGENIVEVKNYLPFENKLELITDILGQSVDENSFYNPMRVKLFMSLEIVYAYTNLTFTQKQKEDPFKLYDSMECSGFFKDVFEAIPECELKEITDAVYETIKNIYNYKNSVMGILDTVSTDYSNLKLDIEGLKQNLAEGNGVEFLQEVLTKLG